MRKVALGLALVLLVLVAGLLAAPYLIGLDSFKAVVVAQIERRMGRPFDIAGPVRLALLPTPSIGARDLRLGNPPGTHTPDMIRIRAVQVKLAFWPLLAGRVEMRRLELVDPELDIERLADGSANWQSGASPLANTGRAAIAPPTPLGEWASIVRTLDTLDVENGTVTYRSGNRVERFEHINGTVVLDGAEGAFHLAGDLAAHGAAINLSADGGRLEGGALPLHLSIAAKPQAEAEFDGTVGGQIDAPDIKGKLKLSVGDLAAALATLRRLPATPALAEPLSLAADLDATGRHVAIEHALVDLGPAHGEGSIALDAKAPFDAKLSLHLTRLDLDRWLDAADVAKSATANLRTTPDGKPALPPDHAAPLVAFTVPDGIRGSLDLSVDDLLWRGGILQGAAVTATLDQGKLRIAQAGALLPGSTTLSAKGTVSSPGGEPRANLQVQLAAADIRGLIRWLGYSVGDVPADRLRGLSLATDVTLSGDQLDLRANDAVLDATRFQAVASVLLRGKPGIGLHVSADHVNLDAYLATSAAGPASPGPPEATAAAPPGASAAADKPMLITLLGNVDANLDVTLGEATWRAQSLRQLRLAGNLQDGGLTIDELSIGDLGGTSGKVTGLVEGLAGGGLKGQLFFDAHGPAFERVLRLAWPDAMFGQSFGAFRLEGGAQVGEGSADLDCDLEVLGGHAHAVGTVSDGSSGTDLTVTLDHPSFTELVRSLWPTYRPAGGDLGALKLSTKVTGGGGRIDFGAFSLAIGTGTMTGTGSLSLDGARPKLTADLALGDWAIDALLPARRTAFDDRAGEGGLAPGVMLAQASAGIASAGIAAAAPRPPPSARWSRNPNDWSDLQAVDLAVTLTGKSMSYGPWRLEQPAATIVLADGTLDLAKLGGRIYGGALDGSLHATTKSTPSLRAQLTVHDADLKAALQGLVGVKAVDGRADLTAELATVGSSQLDLVSHLAGTASIRAHDGSLQGIDVKGVADRLDAAGKPADLLGLAKAMAGGATRFSTLDGSFRLKDGSIAGDDLHLAVEGGDGRGTIAVDLPAWTVDSRIEFRLAGASGVPPLVLRVAGSLDDPHETVDVNALSQFLAQRAAAKAEDADKNDKNPKLRDLLKGLGLHP